MITEFIVDNSMKEVIDMSASDVFHAQLKASVCFKQTSSYDLYNHVYRQKCLTCFRPHLHEG